MTQRGTLILVVGPSGAGKDSIIAGAAERCRGEPRIIFARRVITRPAAAGGESHIAVSPSEFAERRDAGQLMLHWQAHGFDYGLPQQLAAALEQGSSVVANVSRTILNEARRTFSPVTVVAVAASPATLAARLAVRGREAASDIAHRLERAGALSAGESDFTIDNDGPLDVAVDRFIEVLRDVVGGPSPRPTTSPQIGPLRAR
jgi:phosphonate metabolism protein PhnN/1,5-bisphosphokinase (PRPP-forming)